MPQITLTLTATEARAIAALEAIDGKTPDERFAPYVRDIVQNAAGIDLSARPERIESRLEVLNGSTASMAISSVSYTAWDEEADISLTVNPTAESKLVGLAGSILQE